MPTATATAINAGPYTVAVEEAGSGDPLLFLHGFDGPQAADAPFVAGLAANRRVLLPVHPGYSGTETPRALHDLHNVALHYDTLLTSLGVDQVDVVGHSLGAMFALELAALAPGRVRRLALVAPLGIWFDEHPVPEVLASGGSALDRLLWADPASEARPAGASPIERAGNLAAATHYMWPLPDRGVRDRLYRLTMPVLLVGGAGDGLVTAGQIEAWSRELPHAQVARIDGAGHYPMLEQPEAFGSALAGFLSP